MGWTYHPIHQFAYKKPAENVRASLDLTTESIQQWLAQHDAEVQRNTLIDAAYDFDHSAADNNFPADELRRMADEVKP